jgi:hypothetical protein
MNINNIATEIVKRLKERNPQLLEHISSGGISLEEFVYTVLVMNKSVEGLPIKEPTKHYRMKPSITCPVCDGEIGFSHFGEYCNKPGGCPGSYGDGYATLTEQQAQQLKEKIWTNQ